jgi:enoyl-CoA hydratase
MTPTPERNPVPPTLQTLVVEHDGPISWIVLNRPHKLNALSDELLIELTEALSYLESNGGPVIGVRGAGRAFSTGYDISSDSAEAGNLQHRDITEDRARLVDKMERLMGLWDHPKPTIAAVHGYCLAGATQLCVFADITIVADDAVIGEPTLPIGGGYIAPLWSTLIGPKRAKQMSFVAGSTIDAETAVEWGWANYAVPADRLVEDARELAGRIAMTPPEVLRIKKNAVNRVLEQQGFRALAMQGAETDALLHSSGAVRRLNTIMVDEGLKVAIDRFAEGGW